MGYTLWCDKCKTELDRDKADQIIISSKHHGGLGGSAFSLDLCPEHQEELWKDLESLRG